MRVVVGWQGSDRNAARTNTMSPFETETLTQEDNLKGLALMNPQWVELAMAHTPHRRVILDMDSSESPVHGQQEGAAYNGVGLASGCRAMVGQIRESWPIKHKTDRS